MVRISQDVNQYIREVQNNLSRVIRKADDISQEFRRMIHVDMTTSNTSTRLKYVKQLLETDNLIRDVLAKLRYANALINIRTDQEILLLKDQFLTDLYENLNSMFRGFDRIYEVMDFDEREIDILVMETIDVLGEFTRNL